MFNIAIDIRNYRLSVEIGTTPNDFLHWSRIQSGEWERFTFDCIQKYVNTDWTFVDIGAHIGMVTLFASRVSRRVIAVEPDPVACSSLMRNLNLNSIDNVDVISTAISHDRLIYLSSQAFGDSMTNTLGGGANCISVASISFSQLMSRLDADERYFIKLDIEGAEENMVDDIINYVANHSAFFLVSLHGHLSHVSPEYKNKIFRLLSCFDYVEDSCCEMSIDKIMAKQLENLVLCIKD